jgi:hypothetical protein
MLQTGFFAKTYIVLVVIVLVLAILALTAEILPEMEAKIIVIPTLITIIGLTILDLTRWKSRR